MKLMVLDGNSVINRAYYGVRALTTRDGFFTNAIYGFLNILEKLRADEKPDALCVAFDLKAPTFRHLKYDGYKATRHPMPDELAMQMPVMKDVLRAMRIPIFECEGWEADDVIGTIGKRCGHAGWDCVIVTGDRDSLQLIDEHVTVKLVSSKLSQTVAVNYDPAKFREEYGFEPIHLIDLKALMGDSSDNIPGVAGVGPKTATQLLLDYGTLDGVYAHLDAVKEKLRAKLEQGRDSAYLSYDLATIRCEAPIEFSPEACLVQPYDEAALYELFARLEFTRLIARYGLHAPQETAENGMIDGVCTSEVVSEAARAEALAASFQKEHYVNLIAEPDLSAIAVNTDESGYYFCGDALESTKFMSTLFGVSVKKVTHDCKPLMRRLLELGYPAESFISIPRWPPTISTRHREATTLTAWSRICSALRSAARTRTRSAKRLHGCAIGLRRRLRSRHCMRRCRKSLRRTAWKSSIMRSSCRSAGYWPRWNMRASRLTRWP